MNSANRNVLRTSRADHLDLHNAGLEVQERVVNDRSRPRSDHIYAVEIAPHSSATSMERGQRPPRLRRASKPRSRELQPIGTEVSSAPPVE